MEDKNLKETVMELTEVLKENTKLKEKKPKKFKVPFKARLNNKKVRENWVTIIKINENRGLDFVKEKIVEQTVVVDEIPRIATGDVIFTHKRKPFMILPSWSIKPFSPTENYSETEKEKLNTKGYRLILNIMKNEAISKKKKMGWGIAIGVLVIGAVIVYALFTGGA